MTASSASNAITPQNVLRKRTTNLVVGIITMLFLGLIYGFSMFAKPMMQDFGLAGVGFVFNVMMICFCVGSIVGSWIMRKVGVRITLFISAALFAIGFCVTATTCAQGGITVLYVFYAIIGGAGVGIAYNTILATVNLWFPDKVGISSGLLLMGFGISSLVCGNAALALRGLWGSMTPVLIVIGIVGALVTVVLAFVLDMPPHDIVNLVAQARKKNASAAAASADAVKETAAPAAVIDQSKRFENDSLFKTPIFYVYYFINIIMVMMGLGVIGTAAADGMSLGLADTTAALLVGFVATCNGLARIVLGGILDRTSVPTTFTIDAACGLAAMAIIVIAYACGIPALYVVGALLGGFSYGGCPVVGSSFTRKRFGAKNYPSNLAIVNFTIVFGSFFNILLSSCVGGQARIIFFGVILALVVLAFAGTFVFRKQWNAAFSASK